MLGSYFGSQQQDQQVGLDGTSSSPMPTTSAGAAADVEAQAGSSSSFFRVPSSLLGGEQQEEEEDMAGLLCKNMQMSYSTRLKGFAICFALGCLFSLTSTFVLLQPTKFAISYSLGNILSLASTGFIVGPARQVRMACEPIRRVAFVVFILSFIATLISAFVIKKSLVTLLFVIVQMMAGLWYSASYIPYGRQILSSCATNLLGKATMQVQG